MKFINFIIGCIALVSLSKSAPTHHNKYRCGKKYGKCDSDKCCSKYGWCGTSSDYCSISKGCQSEFGICDEKKYTKNNNNKNNKSITVTLSNKTKEKSKFTNIYNNDNDNDKYKSISSLSSESKNENVKWAGFRYSPYGVEDSFGYIPDSNSWKGYVEKMKNNFDKDTKGTIILIVGVESKTNYCEFGFPKPNHVSSSLKVKFSKNDEYEDFLNKCDEQGYNVWLQVEAGDNDLVELANIVFDQYGHHSSVKGFGIDCEWWYRNYTSESNGRPLSDSEAKRIVDAVRQRNANYSVFVKHWETSYMPPNYRDGMIFVNDSQGFHGSIDKMKKEFKEWARMYSNNPVMFQIGYNADKSIWKNSPIEVAKSIYESASEYNEQIGIIWVDFTMKIALNNM